MNGQWMAVSCVWCVSASVVQCMQSVSRAPVCQRCWPPVRCCDSGGWRLVHWGRGTQMMSWLVPVISSTRPRTALSHLGVSRCHTGSCTTHLCSSDNMSHSHTQTGCRCEVPVIWVGQLDTFPADTFCCLYKMWLQLSPLLGEEETVQPSHIDGDFCYSAWHGPS